jgi:hypothetical protein
LIGNTTVGREREASSTAIPTYHGTSMFSLSIDKYRVHHKLVFYHNVRRMAHIPAFLLHNAISATGAQVLVSGL